MKAQYFFNRGPGSNFAPQRTFGNVWRCLGLSQLWSGVGGGWLLPPSGQRPEVLLNILPCSGQPVPSKQRIESESVRRSVVSDSSRLFTTPWTVAHQAPLAMEFSRQDYWSELPFPSPGDFSDAGIELRSPALQAGALPSEPPGKPPQRII